MNSKIVSVSALLFFFSLACGTSVRSTKIAENESIIEYSTATSVPVTLPDTPTPQPTTPPPTPSPLPADTLEAEQVNPIEETKAIITAGDNDVNLRSGPSLEFPVVGALPAGQSLDIIGRNDDSSWWQVSTPDGDAWIAARVVTASNVDENIPVVEIPPAPVVSFTATPENNGQEQGNQPVPTPTEEMSPVSSGSIIITVVNKDEEYIDIKNISGGAIDLSGWRLLSEKGNQNCNLDGVIQPNDTLRIWAPADKADQGGFNCGFDGNIWNNSKTDPAVIYDPNGVEIFRVNCKQKVCQ